MMKQLWPYSMMVILVFGLGAFFAIIYHQPSNLAHKQIAFNEEEVFSGKRPPLVDPQTAPPEIRDQVMQGYQLIMNTQKYAKEYTGDRLNCRNCHFQGGNTWGGKNGSISLVGVAQVYPTYSKRAGKMINLGERINNCFERSLNGKPIPLDDPKMKAMIAYLNWISDPVKNQKKRPWLGLPTIAADYRPNASSGQKLYAEHCAACHKINGQGTHFDGNEEELNIPPLWGEGCFNDGAGMCRINILTSFIWLNMPHMEPILSETEAKDIAQYIINQSRPKYQP